MSAPIFTAREGKDAWSFRIPAQPSEPVFTAREGKVFRRGSYLYQPSRLLAVLLESAQGDDWFAPEAARLATELNDAITVAEDFHQPEQRSAA